MSPAAPGKDVCHLTQGQRSLSDEGKKCKASGNRDPSHKSGECWLQTPCRHGQQECCPLLTVLAGRPAARLPHVVNTHCHNAKSCVVTSMPFFIFDWQYNIRCQVTLVGEVPWKSRHTSLGMRYLQQSCLCYDVPWHWLFGYIRGGKNHITKDTPGLQLCHTTWARSSCKSGPISD